MGMPRVEGSPLKMQFLRKQSAAVEVEPCDVPRPTPRDPAKP